jgi:hypothetical protein
MTSYDIDGLMNSFIMIWIIRKGQFFNTILQNKIFVRFIVIN